MSSYDSRSDLLERYLGPSLVCNKATPGRKRFAAPAANRGSNAASAGRKSPVECSNTARKTNNRNRYLKSSSKSKAKTTAGSSANTNSFTKNQNNVSNANIGGNKIENNAALGSGVRNCANNCARVKNAAGIPSDVDGTPADAESSERNISDKPELNFYLSQPEDDMSDNTAGNAAIQAGTFADDWSGDNDQQGYPDQSGGLSGPPLISWRQSSFSNISKTNNSGGGSGYSSSGNISLHNGFVKNQHPYYYNHHQRLMRTVPSNRGHPPRHVGPSRGNVVVGGESLISAVPLAPSSYRFAYKSPVVDSCASGTLKSKQVGEGDCKEDARGLFSSSANSTNPSSSRSSAATADCGCLIDSTMPSKLDNPREHTETCLKKCPPDPADLASLGVGLIAVNSVPSMGQAMRNSHTSETCTSNHENADGAECEACCYGGSDTASADAGHGGASDGFAEHSEAIYGGVAKPVCSKSTKSSRRECPQSIQQQHYYGHVASPVVIAPSMYEYVDYALVDDATGCYQSYEDAAFADGGYADFQTQASEPEYWDYSYSHAPHDAHEGDCEVCLNEINACVEEIFVPGNPLVGEGSSCDCPTQPLYNYYNPHNRKDRFAHCRRSSEFRHHNSPCFSRWSASTVGPSKFSRGSFAPVYPCPPYSYYHYPRQHPPFPQYPSRSHLRRFGDFLRHNRDRTRNSSDSTSSGEQMKGRRRLAMDVSWGSVSSTDSGVSLNRQIASLGSDSSSSCDVATVTDNNRSAKFSKETDPVFVSETSAISSATFEERDPSGGGRKVQTTFSPTNGERVGSVPASKNEAYGTSDTPVERKVSDTKSKGDPRSLKESSDDSKQESKQTRAASTGALDATAKTFFSENSVSAALATIKHKRRRRKSRSKGHALLAASSVDGTFGPYWPATSFPTVCNRQLRHVLGGSAGALPGGLFHPGACVCHCCDHRYYHGVRYGAGNSCVRAPSSAVYYHQPGSFVGNWSCSAAYAAASGGLIAHSAASREMAEMLPPSYCFLTLKKDAQVNENILDCADNCDSANSDNCNNESSMESSKQFIGDQRPVSSVDGTSGDKRHSMTLSAGKQRLLTINGCNPKLTSVSASDELRKKTLNRNVSLPTKRSVSPPPVITISIPPNCHIIRADESLQLSTSICSSSGGSGTTSSDDLGDLSTTLSDLELRASPVSSISSTSDESVCGEDVFAEDTQAGYEGLVNSTSTPTRSWVPISQVAAHKTVAKFTILCYNILCDKYATPSLYSYCPTWALDWEYRRAKISEEINQFDADIVTLQEVETHEYWHHFHPMLSQKGYDGLFSAKSRAKTMSEHEKRYVDGCAIFWKTNKFSLVTDHLVEFTQLAIDHAQGSEQMLNRVMTRDNIGLVAVLNIKESIYDGEPPTDPAEWVTGGPLVVCTAHIHWDPEFCDVKLIQAMMLVHELRTILDQTAKNWDSLVLHANDQVSGGSRKSTVGMGKQLTGTNTSRPAGGEGEPKSSRRASLDVTNRSHSNSSTAKSALPTRNAASSSPIEMARTGQGDQGGGGDPLAAAGSAASSLSSSLPCSDASITSSCSPSLNSSNADDNNNNCDGGNIDKNQAGSPPNSGRLLSQDIPLLICGDLNSLPDSGVVEFLSTGRISVKHDDFKKFRDDPCMERFGATLEDRDSNYYVHELGVQSAYSMDIMPFTNFTFDFKGIIDYMFATSHTLHRLGVLGPVEPDWFIQNKVLGCPHPLVPSDHFPILSQYAIIPPNLRSEEAQLAYMNAAAAKAAVAADCSGAPLGGSLDRASFDINGQEGASGLYSGRSALSKVLEGLQNPSVSQHHPQHHLQSSASQPSLHPNYPGELRGLTPQEFSQQGFTGPTSLHHQNLHHQYPNPNTHHRHLHGSSHHPFSQQHRSISGTGLAGFISNGGGVSLLGNIGGSGAGSFVSGTVSSNASDLGIGNSHKGSNGNNVRRLNSIPTPPNAHQQRQQLHPQQLLYNHGGAGGGRRLKMYQQMGIRGSGSGLLGSHQNIPSIGALDPAITSVSSGDGSTSGSARLGGLMNRGVTMDRMQSQSSGNPSGDDGSIMDMFAGGSVSGSHSISNQLFHQSATENFNKMGQDANGIGGGDQNNHFSYGFQRDPSDLAGGVGGEFSGRDFFRNINHGGGAGHEFGGHYHDPQSHKFHPHYSTSSTATSNNGNPSPLGMGSEKFLSSSSSTALMSALRQQTASGDSGGLMGDPPSRSASQANALNAILDSHGFSSLISGETRWGEGGGSADLKCESTILPGSS